MNIRIAQLIACLVLSQAAPPAMAFERDSGSGWLGKKCARTAETLRTGRHDLYLPFYAYHGRDTYSSERLEQFNENALGIGFGRSLVTDRGRFRDDWDGVYVMGFRDSHRDLQLMGGYAYQTYLGSETLNFGIGYTAAITSRKDIAKGFPVPLLLPMASINYRDFSLMAAYVPRISGNKGNGDVLFLFGHYSFDEK